MKPFRTLAATILCQSILLSSTAMAKKDHFGETRKDKEKQEERQAGDKKEDQPVANQQTDKKRSKAGAVKRETAKKQQAKKPAPVKKRDLPRELTKPKSKPAQNDAAKKKGGGKKNKADKPTELPGKRPDGGKKDVSDKKEVVKQGGGKKNKADKPMELPGKRPDVGKKDVADKKDVVKQGGGKKNKADKPIELPGKRPNVGKKDVSDKKAAARKDDGKAKTAGKKDDPKNMDSKKSAKQSDKRAKRMDLPGKRPKVSDPERTARAERLQKQVNKRKAEQRLAEAKPQRKAQDRREKIVKAGQNSRQVRRPDVRKNTKNTENNWWNTNNRVTNNRITNKDVRIRNTTVINRNFERNLNWTTRRQDWGYNPWWNRPQTRPWYGSSWNGNWNRDYYRRNYHHGYHEGYHDGYRPPGYSTTSVGAAIGWGLLGWSLGTMVYNTGYQTYQNPYPVSRPVYYGTHEIDYSQPITRIAVQTASEDTAAIVQSTVRSESIIADSQDAFRNRNYLVALELADKAIAESPGDGALHEYRAQILFALGKYGDAAGVLNPVLASGPGWDWSTMIALYDSQQTYTDQLQRLETYSEKHPDSADTHFLLGYHYMVCGHTDLATPQFDLAAKLMPADSVSRQMAELTSASADSDEAEVPTTEEIEELPEPELVPLDKLTGTWTSTRDDGSTVTLVFGEDGKFTWSYVHDGETSAFAGDYSMNDDGLLVLDSEDSQMVATVELPQELEMNFVLAGGPPEDPGLDFTKG
jgi:hypothetical protein